MPNGLRVVFVADPYASEVQVTMRYQVGAVDDPPGQEGIAHLVEHLMFQQVLGAQSLFAKLEDSATSFNAMTTLEATTYTERAHPDRLDELLSIEAVRVGFRCTSISDSAFEREREVVLNEIRERDPSTELIAALHRALYPEGHPYRRWHSEASVGAITREQACAFADAHYTPSNAVLVVSGPITPKRLDEALGKFVVRVPKRDSKPHVRVPAVAAKLRRVDTTAPIDGNAILVAWPLPVDAAERVAVLTAARRIDFGLSIDLGEETQGFVFGDVAAPMYGVLIALDDDDKRTPAEQMKRIESAIESLPETFRIANPGWLATVLFEKTKQGAIYDMFAHLEEGSSRDTLIATNVLAGIDPNAMLRTETEALRGMTQGKLAETVEQQFTFDRATVALLSPSDPVKRGPSTKLAAPVHDIGQRRDPPDPAEAQHPAVEQIPIRATHMLRRTLANGLDVVLLSATSVPTVEVRLVFGSGSADDTEHGAAIVAGKGLRWNARYINELLMFAAAGGTNDVEVGTDQTVFTARGVDMHLDLLLAGLRHWVRDGMYSAGDIDGFRRWGNRTSNDRVLDDTWRASLFGADHPYAQVHAVSDSLAISDVKAFRTEHYTPDNATLVVTGHFDANLADKWIDYLFSDWTGAATTSDVEPAVSQAASIAYDETTTQVGVRIAIPARHGDRAAQLVTAAMLDAITSDVRHQLGASYGFDAHLDEKRLASTYVLAGWVDATRAHEAIELVTSRLAALRDDPEATARLFVTGRKRVLTHLLASTSSALELAERVQRDLELRRTPLSDAKTAEGVNTLTLEAVSGALADLDLTRAVVLMRGPHDDVDRAFASMGRTAKRITAVVDEEDPNADEDDTFSVETADDEDKPLGPLLPWTFSVFGGYSVAYTRDQGLEGFGVSANVGYRLSRKLTVGVRASIADLDGSYEGPSLAGDKLKISATPVTIAGFVHAVAQDRLWGGAFAGVNITSVTDNHMPHSVNGLSVGLEGGYDVARFSKHRLAVYGRVETELSGSPNFAGFTFGLGYRR
jgi:zinc protease